MRILQFFAGLLAGLVIGVLTGVIASTDPQTTRRPVRYYHPHAGLCAERAADSILKVFQDR